MRLFVRNSADSLVEVAVKPSATVALVKATYRRTGGFLGNRNHIQLQYRGEVLDDTLTLKHYHIKEEAVLLHPTSSRLQVAYGAIDYDAMAVQLEKEYEALRGGQDLGDYDPSKDGGGADWDATPQVPAEVEYVAGGMARPPQPPGGYSGAAGAGGASRGSSGDLQSLALARAPAAHVVPYGHRGVGAPTAPEESGSGTAGQQWSTPSRVFRQVYVAQVGKFQFRLLHRMEGRWNGDAQIITASGAPAAPPSVVSVSLSWDDNANVWEETQSITDSSGLANAQTLQLVPVGDGVAKVVQKGSTAWGDVDMELREESDHVLLMTATSHATGRPILVETVTVVDDMRRVRTVQRFDASGAFQCMYCFKEARVIDAVSGALVPGASPASPAPQASGPPTFPFPHPGVVVSETEEEGGPSSPVRGAPFASPGASSVGMRSAPGTAQSQD